MNQTDMVLMLSAGDAGPEQVPPKKRTLQDLMGGGAEGETVIGFGKAATNSSEGDPFKKSRAEP